MRVRLLPDRNLWPALFDLSEGEREVIDRFDSVLHENWRIYVRPFLNGLCPSIVLYHPDSGFGVYDVVDWGPSASRFEVRVSDKDGPVLYRDGDVLEGLFNPVARVRHWKRLFGSMITGVSGSRAAFGLITGGLIFTDDAACDQEFLDLVARCRTEENPSWLTIQHIESISAEGIRSVLPRVFGHSGQMGMTNQIRRMAVSWLEPRNYFGSGFGFELDAAQQRIVNEPPPPGTRMRRVRGPAGSGKSVVLAARAARLGLEGIQVLVVCYNVALRNYLKELVERAIAAFCSSETDSFRARDRVVVVNFHSWQYRSEGTGRRYGAVLVDEGQDFELDWWNALRRYPLHSGSEMLLMADTTQDVYQRSGSWTEAAMRDSGFRGAWSRLGGNYRVPSALVESVKSFGDSFLSSESDLPVARQMGLTDSYPVRLNWVQVEPDELISAAASEALRLADYALSDGQLSDLACLFLANRQGANFLFQLREAWEGDLDVDTVFPCPREDSVFCRLGSPCDGCSVFGSASEPDDSSLKVNFGLSYGLRVSTFHSFKGWESRHLLVVLGDLNSSVGIDKARLFYVALTRILRHERGSSLTVVCSEPRLREWASHHFRPVGVSASAFRFARVLDQAVAGLLSRFRGLGERAAVNAVRSLGGLLTGQMPDYKDPVVCGAYLAQYQLRQVNLACSLFREKLQRNGNWRQGLQLVDFGAGSLAGVIGLAMAVADLDEMGFDVGDGPIYVDCFDSASEMMMLGEELFNTLQGLCVPGGNLEGLARALGRIEVECYDSLSDVCIRPLVERWVSGFHVFYEGGEGEVISALRSLKSRLDPSVWLLTANQSKEAVAVKVIEGSGLQLEKRLPGSWILPSVLNGSVSAALASELGLLPARWQLRDRFYGHPSRVIYWDS